VDIPHLTLLSPQAQVTLFQRVLIHTEQTPHLPVPGGAGVDIPHLTLLSPQAQVQSYQRVLIHTEQTAHLPVPGRAGVDIPHLTLLCPQAQVPSYQRVLIHTEQTAHPPVPDRAGINIPHLTFSTFNIGNVLPENINSYRAKCSPSGSHSRPPHFTNLYANVQVTPEQHVVHLPVPGLKGLSSHFVL
jgi:hypothetical protein